MIRRTRWGEDEVIYETDTYKVKILTIAPGKGTSLQRHHRRAERWTNLEGFGAYHCEVSEDGNPKVVAMALLPRESVMIENFELHQLWNFEDEPLKVLETQFATANSTQPGVCSEDDIERIRYTWEP